MSENTNQAPKWGEYSQENSPSTENAENIQEPQAPTQPPAYGDYGANQQPANTQPPAYEPPPAYGQGQQPQYGQVPAYGQGQQPPYGNPPTYGQPYYGYPVPPRNMNGDKVASIILLSLGGLNAFFMIMTAIALPQAMEQLYLQYGIGHYIAPAGMWVYQLAIVLAHLVPLGIAIIWTVKRIKAGKFSFWISLVFAVIAFALFISVFFALIINDPNLMNYLVYSQLS